MRKKENNYAFIDSQNLNLAIRGLGWILDFRRFRVYLREKYGVTEAFLFIGYIEGNTDLYTSLQTAGFICIFKPTLEYKDGTTKGNCDAELVLQAMIEYPNYDKAVIVTGDGDFYCLAKYLVEKGKFEVLIVPNKLKFSALLKFKIFRPYLRFMNELRGKLEYKKKRPPKDETLEGNLFRS
ncbi:MAG: NYN domain-containing protein [Minisyncoccia bacterium]